jgi:hypothetical protein
MEQIDALLGLGGCLASWRTGNKVDIATAWRLMPCKHNHTKSNREWLLSYNKNESIGDKKTSLNSGRL